MELFPWLQDIPGWAYAFGAVALMYGFNQQAERKRREKWEQRIIDDFDEVVEWLREIDPRMQEEQELIDEAWDAVENDKFSLAPALHLDLERKKREAGERTVTDPLRREWRRKMEEEFEQRMKKSK